MRELFPTIINVWGGSASLGWILTGCFSFFHWRCLKPQEKLHLSFKLFQNSNHFVIQVISSFISLKNIVATSLQDEKFLPISDRYITSSCYLLLTWVQAIQKARKKMERYFYYIHMLRKFFHKYFFFTNIHVEGIFSTIIHVMRELFSSQTFVYEGSQYFEADRLRFLSYWRCLKPHAMLHLSFKYCI